MKILFRENKYIKESDDIRADLMVKKQGYRYVPRSEWKKNVRDIKIPVKVEEPKHQEKDIVKQEKPKYKKKEKHGKV